jgi:hypothetical protein
MKGRVCTFKVGDNVDAEISEVARGANAREHEDLRRVDGARCQNNLAARSHRDCSLLARRPHNRTRLQQHTSRNDTANV